MFTQNGQRNYCNTIYSSLLISTMNRIKEILLEQGRPQTSLAEKIGKSYVAVTN